MGWESGRARESIGHQAKLVGVLLFCLVNPFAGWAYLATHRARWAERVPPISDTLKQKRLVVLPPLGPDGASSLTHAWNETVLTGLRGFDALEAIAYLAGPESVDVDRDPLALGQTAGAELVVDASLSLEDDELLGFVRLLRLADRKVLWSHAFEGTEDDFESLCDETVLGVLGTLATE